MKKVTPVLIIAVFFSSILLIGFLGVRTPSFTDIILVESIRIENQNINFRGNINNIREYGITPWSREQFAQKLQDDDAWFDLVWSINPNNATNQNVTVIMPTGIGSDVTWEPLTDRNGIRVTFNTDRRSTRIELRSSDDARSGVALVISTPMP